MEPEATSATPSGHRDHVLPEGKWRFDAEVTDAFDEMLRRSIPQYEVMRQAVFEIASRFAVRKTAILDLGCSRGEALAPLVSRFGVNNRFVGVEVSQPMLDAARERFRGMIDCGVVSIREMDLRHGFPPERASVILSVLTLQFTPIEYRLKIVREAFNSLVPGGALILVEKVLGASADLDAMLVDLYYGMKRENGYSQEEIDRKRLSLEGVLVPVTAAWNEQLLHQCGFSEVDCFWRYLNFAGWVAIK
jgi:tRNA (cmo5U34)-methyltransferase